MHNLGSPTAFFSRSDYGTDTVHQFSTARAPHHDLQIRNSAKNREAGADTSSQGRLDRYNVDHSNHPRLSPLAGYRCKRPNTLDTCRLQAYRADGRLPHTIPECPGFSVPAPQPVEFGEVVENLPALRLRRLDVEFNPLPKDLGPLMLLRAPNLECLTISSLEFVSIVRWPPYVQRTRLLSGQVTGLKALALQAMVTWLPTNHFPALTHLYLSIVSLHTPELRVSDILPLLANTPQLEFAHIVRIIYSTVAEPPAPVVTPIMLPRLRSLACVSWAHVRAVTLLAYLQLPDYSRTPHNPYFLGRGQKYGVSEVMGYEKGRQISAGRARALFIRAANCLQTREIIHK